jgi:DNA-binding GntR family transcriptional regulator
VQCWELTIARASLESLAAYLAAQRMNDETASRIWSAAGKFRIVRPATYAEHAALELEFHRSVWEASGNEWLAKLLIQLVIPLLSMPVQRMLMPDLDFEAYCRNSPELEASDPNRHEVVADELIKGQADGVRSRMFRHITEARIKPGPELAMIAGAMKAMRPNDLA